MAVRSVVAVQAVASVVAQAVASVQTDAAQAEAAVPAERRCRQRWAE
jgi:hypothetical protein